MVLNLSRIFWTVLFLGACTGPGKKEGLSIVWDQELPVALKIPDAFYSRYRPDSARNLLSIHVMEQDVAVLGDYKLRDGALIFTPLIPFTRGLTYEIRLANASIATIAIPLVDSDDSPVLTAIYPSQDTLPANLLKVYLQFSRPMREGRSLQHIILIRNGKDTVPPVFLDLQPELWNKERTTLTLWLDPGRIKRDLQPNQALGPPLETPSQYRLIVNSDWTDVRGAKLKSDVHKDFFVSSRDSLSPDPGKWRIDLPASGTTQPMSVTFFESLDEALLYEAIRILDNAGDDVKGKIELTDEENRLLFTPETPWLTGNYVLRCDAYLEDLAGNNLNRLFDRDVSEIIKRPANEVFIRKFEIR